MTYFDLLVWRDCTEHDLCETLRRKHPETDATDDTVVFNECQTFVFPVKEMKKNLAFNSLWLSDAMSCQGSWFNIGSGNGLSPGRHQATAWTNADLLTTGPLLRNKFQWNSDDNSNVFHWRKYIWICPLQKDRKVFVWFQVFCHWYNAWYNAWNQVKTCKISCLIVPDCSTILTDQTRASWCTPSAFLAADERRRSVDQSTTSSFALRVDAWSCLWWHGTRSRRDVPPPELPHHEQRSLGRYSPTKHKWNFIWYFVCKG